MERIAKERSLSSFSDAAEISQIRPPGKGVVGLDPESAIGKETTSHTPPGVTYVVVEALSSRLFLVNLAIESGLLATKMLPEVETLSWL